MITKGLVAPAHVPLLLVLCVSGRGTGRAAYGRPDQSAGAGITVSDIVADNCARDAAKGCSGKGSGLCVWASGTTREVEREGGGESGQEFAFHDMLVWG